MRSIKKSIRLFVVICVFGTFAARCGPVVVVRQPPPPRTEVRPAKPWVNAVWISGHWRWSGGRYVWVSGHWAKPKPGKTWVPGHWRKTPRGHVWVKGYWR